MLLDEAENCTFLNIKMFITRFGLNSTLIINGDTKQSDLYGREQSGLEEVAQKLKNVEGCNVVRLGKEDILRSGIIARVLTALEL